MVKVRSRKRWSGSIGSALRRSSATNAAIPLAAQTNASTMSGDDQPRADRSISAQVKAASPNAPATCAPRSNALVADAGLRCTKRSASRTPSTPIGTLMRKMLRHPNAWMRAPPTNGPLAPVTAVRLLQMPIARARSTGSG